MTDTEMMTHEEVDTVQKIIQRDCAVGNVLFDMARFAVTRIPELEAELAKTQKWNQEMVEKAASGGTLDAYREMGQRIAELEAALAECRPELLRTHWTLEEIRTREKDWPLLNRIDVLLGRTEDGQ